MAHLAPLLDLQQKHGILTASYGPLTPTIRHPTGGPLKPVLHRIAARVSKALGKEVDANVVLLLWTRSQKVVAVTTSANDDRIKTLGEIETLPNLLTPEEIEEISDIGKTVHFRFYVSRLQSRFRPPFLMSKKTEHMEKDFPLPDLPRE